MDKKEIIKKIQALIKAYSELCFDTEKANDIFENEKYVLLIGKDEFKKYIIDNEMPIIDNDIDFSIDYYVDTQKWDVFEFCGEKIFLNFFAEKTKR